MIDLSKGSNSTYLVEARHNLIQPCLQCGKFEPVLLDSNQYYDYFMKGNYVQNAFPNLSAEERDLISVGIHPACSAAFYGPEPEDDE